MKKKLTGVKIGILVRKKSSQEKNENEKFQPYAPFPEEHAKFVRNMFSVLEK